MLKRIDLERDYRRHREEYLEAIRAVCEETAFSGGRFADRFEKEFADHVGVKACAAVNSGTSALHLAMMALGVGPGDEVIVPANTFIATAWGVSYTGATPVFADCTADTWEIDPEDVRRKITKKTKAIIGVHLYGQPFDVAAVSKIAKEHGLYLVEDCAQAHDALFEGKKAGSLCDIGCFSFYPGKNLYAFGEGGAVTSNRTEWIDKIQVIKNQGSKERYRHELLGFNYRMEGIQGAVLSVSLRYLEDWTTRRREIGKRYLAEIRNKKLLMQAHPENTTPVFHLFELQTENPEALIAYMREHDTECNRHYPVPCHLQEAYRHLGYKKGDCPNAEQLADRCVTLPLFPEMTEEEVSLVIDLCNRY